MYPTTAELVAASGVEELTSLVEARQDALRASAISAIESYTAQSFEPFDGVLAAESAGGRELWLPRRLRVLRSATPYNGDPLEFEPLMVSDDGARIVWRENVVGVGYYSQALWEVSDRDYPREFPSGATIYVEGEWGYDEVPSAVFAAILADMEDSALADANALTPTVNVARKLGLKGVRQGNLSVDLGAVASVSPRVERLLEDYVFFGRGGHLV